MATHTRRVDPGREQGMSGTQDRKRTFGWDARRRGPVFHNEGVQLRKRMRRAAKAFYRARRELMAGLGAAFDGLAALRPEPIHLSSTEGENHG